MKLFKMKHIIDKNTEDQELFYIVKLENEQERGVYEATHNHYTEIEEKFWDYYLDTFDMPSGTSLAYYLMEDEEEPKIGGTFELDGMEWERVA